MYLFQILLTLTDHLPPQQDDCRGLQGSGWEEGTCCENVAVKKKESFMLVGAGSR